MKGNVLLLLSVILMLMAFIFWPVFKITDHAGGPLSPTSSTPSVHTAASPFIASSLRVTLLLHATHSPLHCSISQRGITLLTETNSVAPGEYRTAVNISKGEDLLVTAEWKDQYPHELQVEVFVHGYQAPLERSFWAEQTLSGTLPIPDSFLPSSQDATIQSGL